MINVGMRFNFNKFHIYIDYQFDMTINRSPCITSQKLDHRYHIFISKEMTSENLDWMIKFITSVNEINQYCVIIHIPKYNKTLYSTVAKRINETKTRCIIFRERLSHCSIFAKNEHDILALQANQMLKKYYYQWATLERK